MGQSGMIRMPESMFQAFHYLSIEEVGAWVSQNHVTWGYPLGMNPKTFEKIVDRFALNGTPDIDGIPGAEYMHRNRVVRVGKRLVPVSLSDSLGDGIWVMAEKSATPLMIQREPIPPEL